MTLRRLGLAAVLLASLGVPASAQVFVNGASATIGGVTMFVWNGQNISTSNPVPVNVVSGGGGGGGGATGSVTAAGTNGTQAQAVQGITGGIPQNSFPAQYNSTLPTFSNAAPGYLSVDVNGRLILAPSSSVGVSNFPATQAVSNAGTFAVQNTAAVVGGNITAVKTDGSATTQPVSGTVSALNLGIYNSTAPTIASGAQTILQTSSNGSLFADLSRSTLPAFAAIPAFKIDQTTPGATNKVSIGVDGTVAATQSGAWNLANITGTVSLPTGAATAANQSSEITQLTTIATRSGTFTEQTAASIAASSNFLGPARTPAAGYSRFNVSAGCTQSATVYILGSNDNFTNYVTVGSATVGSGSSNATTAVGGSISTPVTFSSYKFYIVNGASANTCTSNSSFTAN